MWTDGAAIGVAIAAVLDMVLDAARDRRRGPPGQSDPAREDRARAGRTAVRAMLTAIAC